jgi:hypothetical protein
MEVKPVFAADDLRLRRRHLPLAKPRPRPVPGDRHAARLASLEGHLKLKQDRTDGPLLSVDPPVGQRACERRDLPFAFTAHEDPAVAGEYVRCEG